MTLTNKYGGGLLSQINYKKFALFMEMVCPIIKLCTDEIRDRC